MLQKSNLISHLIKNQSENIRILKIIEFIPLLIAKWLELRLKYKFYVRFK